MEGSGNDLTFENKLIESVKLIVLILDEVSSENFSQDFFDITEKLIFYVFGRHFSVIDHFICKCHVHGITFIIIPYILAILFLSVNFLMSWLNVESLISKAEKTHLTSRLDQSIL